ncbi:MAG: protein arginine kinase [Phycisphaeraceae bacterium]|nr:protein arginine kinase [Phycisphaeraceae bacterium]
MPTPPDQPESDPSPSNGTPSGSNGRGERAEGVPSAPNTPDRPTEWLRAEGPDSDVVLSSRVRLARNLVGFPFVHRCSREDRLALMGMIRRRLEAADHPTNLPTDKPGAYAWVPIHELAPTERTLLVERHLISTNLAKGWSLHGAKTAKPPPDAADLPRALAHSPDERLAIMVNEEDHLRIQSIASGLALDQAADAADRIDDFLEAALDFAYSPRFGYLTACPTNVGTGIRCSVMLHLPALRLSGEIDKVKRAASDMTLAVRGFYGEGSDAIADLFQISNQTTLGKTERVIQHELAREIIPRVIEYERTERRKLLERKPRVVEDQAWRALGLLRNARLLSTEEALSALSAVRLGVVAGVFAGEVTLAQLNHLLLIAQPAHLQAIAGRPIDPERARAVRADLLRERLAR